MVLAAASGRKIRDFQMRIIITDTGNIWNPHNPYLEQFRDIVLIVCLNGKKATDQYPCFVSPYQQEGVETNQYGGEDQRLQALASVAGELDNELHYHDDIVFLTDNEPSTLYPYYVLKDLEKYNWMHLVAMSPWDFEGSEIKNACRQMLADLSKLDSILYYDSNARMETVEQKGTLTEKYESVKNYLGGLMPCFLNGIYKMMKKPRFFDFASMSYVLMKSGYENIDLSKKNKVDKEIIFPIRREFCTLGIIYPHTYPDDADYVKEKVEKPTVRLDGKKVCNILREQRIRLAEANHISFRSTECPSIGPCAGTCEKCEMELKYLGKQLRKIPEEQRVYPQFDPKKEMML